MKKITFLLSLVSATLTVTTASAALSTDDGNLCVLPSFNVTADRFNAAEKAINRSLADFAASAQGIPQIRTELPALKAAAQRAKPDSGRSVAHAPARRATDRS